MAITEIGYLFIHKNRDCAFVLGFSEDRAKEKAKVLLSAVLVSSGRDGEVVEDQIQTVPLHSVDGETTIAFAPTMELQR